MKKRQSIEMMEIYRKTRTALLVFGMLLASLVVGYVAFDSWFDHRETLALSEKRLVSYRIALAEHAAQTFNSTRWVLDQAYTYLNRRNLASFPEAEVHAYMKNLIRHFPHVGWINIKDRNAVNVANTMEYPVTRKPHPDLDYFKYHKDNKSTEQLFFSKPALGAVTHRWRFFITRRLSDGSGRFAGVIGCAFDPTYYDAFYKNIDLGKTGRVLLIRDDGQILVQTPFAEEAMKTNLSDRLLFTTYLPHSPSGVFRNPAAGFDSNDRIVAYQRLKGYPIVAVVSMTHEEAIAPWIHRTFIKTGLTLVLLLTSFCLSRLILKYLDRAAYAENEAIQAEEALRESESLFRALFDAAPYTVVLTDLEGRYLLVNKAFESSSGIPASEALGKTSREIGRILESPDSAVVAELMEKGRVENCPAAIRLPDGKLRNLLFSSTVLQLGGANRVLSVTVDITALKQAEEELKISEERFRSTFNQAAVGIAHVSPDGRFMLTNQRFCDIVGYTPDEIMTLTFQDITYPADLQADLDQVREIIEGRLQTYSMEKRYIRKDGSLAWVNLTVALLREPHGKPKYFISVIEDIGKRKKAQEALRESEARFRSIITVSNTGAWEYHLEKDYLWCSPEYFTMLGRDPGDFVMDGRANLKETWLDLLHPDDRERAGQHFADYLKGGAVGMYENYFRMRHVDGSWVWIWSRGQTLRNPDGSLTDMTVGTHINVTENRRAEETLRLSEEKYRDMFQNAAEGIFQTTTDGVLLSANPALAKMAGYASPEVMVTSIKDVGPQLYSNLEDRRHLVRMLREKDRVEGFEMELQRRDRTKGWMSINIRAVRDETGNILYLEGTAVDITERKKAEQELHRKHEELSAAYMQLAAYDEEIRRKYEELSKSQRALRQSEEKYRELVESANSIILRMDRLGTITFVNEYATHFFKYSRDELIGRNVIGTIVPEQDTSGRDLRAMILDIGRNPDAYKDNLNENMCSDGARVWVSWTNRPIFAEDGRHNEILCIGNDVTEHKRAEEKLIDSEARLRAIIDSAPDAIFIRDRENRYLLVNKAFPKLFGIGEGEIVGQTFDSLFDEASIARVREESERVLAGEIVEAEVERVVNGSPRTFSMIKAPLRNHLGEISGICGIGRDITDRRNLENQLFQSQKMEAIGTLAGGIAHDFNNILTAIIGFLELSLEEMPGNHPLRENLRQILSSGMRARALVSQILTFSRHDGVQIGPVIPAPLVKEAVKMLRASLPSTIRIRHSIQSPTDTIRADATHLYQIITNLATNAADAMRDAGGTLEIRVERVDVTEQTPELSARLTPGSYIRLSVKDTGVGMDRATKERIFEPFFTTKPKGKGTGLGLSVVYGIVKSHMGTILVDSEPGRGSTFDVYFPRDRERELSKKEAPRDIPGGTEHILLVDDEVIVADTAQKLLKRLGYQVTMRTGSVDALEAFRAQPERFDLVISDVTMPNMTGTELARQILNIRPGMPVILCTGFSELIDDEKMKTLGIRDLIMKPMTYRDLAEKVRVVLDAG